MNRRTFLGGLAAFAGSLVPRRREMEREEPACGPAGPTFDECKAKWDNAGFSTTGPFKVCDRENPEGYFFIDPEKWLPRNG